MTSIMLYLESWSSQPGVGAIVDTQNSLNNPSHYVPIKDWHVKLRDVLRPSLIILIQGCS